MGCQTYSLRCTLAVCMSVTRRIGSVWLHANCSRQHEVFSKRQVAGAIKAREPYEKFIYPLTADFRAIVAAGGVPGSDVTIDDVKAAEVIWG
jgi:hypothetical protein